MENLHAIERLAAHPLSITEPFFTVVEHLGVHNYFRSLAAATTFQAAHGGYILMTTANRIWRVTQPSL